MFDRFEVPPDTICPGCKEQVEELQTKAFPNAYLRTIKLHGSLPDSDELQITDGSVEAYESCGRCHYWLEYRAIVKDGKYAGVELIKAEVPSEKVDEAT